MDYFDFLILFLSLLLFCYFYREKNGFPTNWPLLGMIPALLQNYNRFHDYCIPLIEICGLTFIFKGPWFTNMQYVLTLDPANIQHVMSRNFANYPKGSKFNEMFDVLGDGIFNADSVVWQYHRKMFHSFLTHPNYHHFLVGKIREKVKNGLIPVLNHVANHAIEVDLQDLFTRFTFDVGCMIFMGHDPKALSTHFPMVPPSMALDDLQQVIFYRHVVPPFVWKFQRWLNVGSEKRYKKAWETLDSFIYKYLDAKKEEKVTSKTKEENIDLLTLYMKEVENNTIPVGYQGDKFIRDTILTNFIAGRDAISIALSWFFYLLAKNPQIGLKIKEEVDNAMPINWSNLKEVNTKLVYLHAALCETLRLYAPVSFESKSPIEPDILPSGHKVTPNMQILFDIHAMGRMKSIWGEDCNEFKPERWITEQGKIRHVSSNKYFVFNAGPRACLGKEMAFTQMKIVITTIIQNYVVQPVEEHRVVPRTSIFLHMRYGFKVRIFKNSN